MGSDSFRLGGQVTRVTGAARGVGRAIAVAMACAGADVWINDLAEKEDTSTTLAAPASSLCYGQTLSANGGGVMQHAVRATLAP